MSILNDYPQVGLNAEWNSECWQITDTLFVFADEYNDENFSVIKRVWNESEECNNDCLLFSGTDIECLQYIKE